jgi:hypothetical protein
MVVAAAVRISHGTCHKILSDDLSMPCVTQHSISCNLMQDQCDNRKNSCGDVIQSTDKDGMCLTES